VVTLPEAGEEEGYLGVGFEGETSAVGVEAAQHAVDALRAQLEAAVGQRQADLVPYKATM
jgi:hypothetical protein